MRGPCEQHSLSEPRCGFEKRVGSSPAVGGREWAAHLRRTCPPPAPWRRGWRALSQLWSPQAPPCLLLTLPLLWEILSRSPLNRKGCQSGGLHPLTSLDRDVLRGQQGPDSGRDPSPALGSYLTMAGTRLPQLARRPHQRPLFGTRARQVPARRQLQALAPRLAPAGPAAAARTSLGTASPLKGCLRAAVPAASPAWLPATSGWGSAVGR